MLSVKHCLPLAHHPQHTIIENHDQQRQFLRDGSRQLLQAHSEGTVSGKKDCPFLVVGDASADCRPQPEAHCPQSS